MSSYPVKDPDAPSGSNTNKAYLLLMEFTSHEVDLAIERLGEDAQIDELVDFIAATHIAQENEKDIVWTNHLHEGKNEDFDVLSESLVAKKEILLEMNFSLDEINLAMEILGENTPTDKLLDYIIDSRRTQESEKDDICAHHCKEQRNEESLDKGEQLLQMGFSEQEISEAIKINGLDKSLTELVESVISGQATSFNKNSSRSSGIKICEPTHKPRLFGGLGGTSSSVNIGLKDKGKMKIILEENEDEEDDD